MFFKVKFITEFISAIKNTKNLNLKGIESLEMAKSEKNGFFDILKFFFSKYMKSWKKPPKKSIIDNIQLSQKDFLPCGQNIVKVHYFG